MNVVSKIGILMRNLSVRVAKRIEIRDVGKTSRYNPTQVGSLEVTGVGDLVCIDNLR